MMDYAFSIEKKIKRVEMADRIIAIGSQAAMAFTVLSTFIMLFVFGLAFKAPLFMAMASMLFALICFVIFGTIARKIALFRLIRSLNKKDGRETTNPTEAAAKAASTTKSPAS